MKTLIFLSMYGVYKFFLSGSSSSSLSYFSIQTNSTPLNEQYYGKTSSITTRDVNPKNILFVEFTL